MSDAEDQKIEEIVGTYQKQADGSQHPPDVKIGNMVVHDNGWGTIQISNENGKEGCLVACVQYPWGKYDAEFTQEEAYLVGKKIARILCE